MDQPTKNFDMYCCDIPDCSKYDDCPCQKLLESFSSGGHFVQWSGGTIYAILVEGMIIVSVIFSDTICVSIQND